MIDVGALIDARDAYKKGDLKTLLTELYYPIRRTGPISWEATGLVLGSYDEGIESRKLDKIHEFNLKTSIGTIKAGKHWRFGWKSYIKFQSTSGKSYTDEEAIEMYFKMLRKKYG